MHIEDMHALQIVWVILTDEDMYGAGGGTDNVIEARVARVEERTQDVTVDGLEDDCEFVVYPSQCFTTEAEARASISKSA